MEKDFTPNGKEVLFVPPPSEAVVSLETHFKNEGVRFSWINDHEELVRRVTKVPPFLLVLDLSRLNWSIGEVFPQIEDCVDGCKTVVFGGDVAPWTLGVPRVQDFVFFPGCLKTSVLTTVLEKVMADGEGFFKRNSAWKSPYYLLFCHSSRMKKIKTIIDQVAHTDISVLIQGERGTGKELVARAIHCCSLRRTKPFIKVNCTAIPRELLESEFFGFEKGTFAGTYARRPGRLELANEGTILLDEVGELDGSLQAKVLQVLQERELYRLGGENSIGINTRVIACTEVNLEKVVEASRFRKDLYDYLNVVNISVPPLRERREEIPSLTKYFLNLYNAHYGRSFVDLSKETEQFFMNYDWPGNIRQLQNAIKRIVVLKDEEQVIREIPEKQRATSETPVPISALSQIPEGGGDDLKEVGRRAAKEAERVVIQKMLEETRWNRRETAERLQISYKALLYKIKEYGLDQ